MDELREITEKNLWKEKILDLAKSSFSEKFRQQFQTYWTEAGHRIKQQVQNDELLIKFLRRALPAYEGEDMILYRGENLDRYQRKQFGLFWTPKIHIATMFARGLNAVDSGGILLRSQIPSTAIISGPSGHSLYLGEHEYTIDVFKMPQVEEIEKFPAVFYHQ